MEDLSDLTFDCKLSSVALEDLYSSIDNDVTDCGADMSRPSSTVSFSSWTFSPISEDNNDLDHLDDNKAHQKPELAVQPVSATIQPVSATIQPVSAIKPVSTCVQPAVVPHQYPTNQPHYNPSCDFVYPNTITYHQSVNIHNYVGNYCIGAPVWKPEYVWDRPVPSQTPFLDRPDTPQQLIDHHDPLANLNTAGLEFTRCSTPEYLMALNSLNQLDSPPRPNHSLAMNYNCTTSFEESINKSTNNIKHDSGYNSDLNASPVIQLQDGNGKHLRQKQTSTPQHQPIQPPPVLRMMDIPQNNKENVPQQFVPQTFTIPTPRFLTKPQCSDIQSESVLMQPGGYLKSTLHKPLVDTNGPKYKTMADYQIAKKTKAEAVKAAKRKNESEISSDSKRRRHNEPLSNKALQVMNEWYEQHLENPYPTKAEKEDLAKRGGITLGQVKSWYANKRNRSNNTRPKKQKKEMEGRLMDICHQLARDASKPDKDNAYYIQQLSSILDTTKYC
ncbi:uncharacterized protein LOC132757921 [Ruditapes philippinarum]|uniref:uncharacterized protein LOC132757921 n=1 Tax=Ruditapes philippinarum TaxID=129788 RepID=UPI00295B17F7|nr:uncharacterized protein LOC132757921 [Ruditapes philippinarum]